MVARSGSPTYYLKQLALAAVREAFPATPVELDIQVANSEPRPASGDDDRAALPVGAETAVGKFGPTTCGRPGSPQQRGFPPPVPAGGSPSI